MFASCGCLRNLYPTRLPNLGMSLKTLHIRFTNQCSPDRPDIRSRAVWLLLVHHNFGGHCPENCFRGLPFLKHCCHSLPHAIMSTVGASLSELMSFTGLRIPKVHRPRGGVCSILKTATAVIMESRTNREPFWNNRHLRKSHKIAASQKTPCTGDIRQAKVKPL